MGNTKFENVVLVVVLVSAVLLGNTLAGPTNLRNDKAVAQRHADTAKTVDPDAGVTYAAIKADLESVSTALDAVTMALEAIDMSTIDPAAFTGAQKTCIQNLKGNLNALKVATKDLKVAARNNAQAANKLVKKFRESERIEQEAGVK
jgi:hypothetical protein